MKKTIIILFFLILCCGLMAKEDDVKVCEGVAERSKAGLVVAGVMITSFSEDEMEKYAGKFVRVKGFVQYKHMYQVDESDPVKKQGFNMPVMYKIVSIEIIEKQ